MTIIAFEGIDHSGKSTQIQLLQQALEKLGKKSVVIRFPSRETPIGQLLDSILRGASAISSREAIHLLFSANRWEKLYASPSPNISNHRSEIMQHQHSGTLVILDRYKASGIAYSLANGLPFDWCMGADSKLPDPDLTVFLQIKLDLASSRDGYGDEIYDVSSFQEKVACGYSKLISHGNWYVVDATKPPDQINNLIMAELLARAFIK